MEMIVTLVRLVYHDVPCIGLELEVADAILLNVSHYVRKHTLNEDGAYFARVVFLKTSIRLYKLFLHGYLINLFDYLKKE
jgi:hypothetical protein